MKHAIYPEKTGTLTSTSEDADYLVTNLSNNIRKKLWKALAGDHVATLTVNISADASVIALDNTNAETAVVKIYPLENAGGVKVQETTHTLETSARTFDNFWEEYPTQAVAHSATILLTAAAGETVQAGILRAGTLETIKGPSKGTMREGKRNYHIIKQYKSGSEYTKKRDCVRTFSYSIMATRSTHFYDLMELYDYWGPDPFMMLLTDEDTDKHWTVFGRFDGDPSGGHNFKSQTLLSVSILEVV